jgi:uncharacterized protein YdaU (DUF1376 family)
MHYYQFNIGDYASHTRYLTPMQDLAYRRLLDLYYLQEKPIPKDNPAVLIGLSDCSTDVERVLNEYFLLTEKGWVNKRADEAIREFHSKKKTASLAGKKSAEARKANKDTGLERPLNEPINSVQPTNNHKPITINQEPIITTPPKPPKGVDDSFEEFWKMYPKKIGKGGAEKAWEKIRSAKDNLDAIKKALSWQTKSEQWTKDKGQFIPLPATYLNQQRWLDEKPSTAMSSDVRDW